MKKKIIIALFAFMLPFSTSYANVDDDDWTYFFHLEYKQGILAVEEGVAYPYDSIPVYFDGPTDKVSAEQMDFYGIIVSGKGVKLAYFGFNKPETTVAALGKSVFIAKAPFYANASRVDFYQRSGKKLFTISVSGSSFCDDNNKCNSNVGENYRNCPNDCPPPPGGIPPREIVSPQQAVTPPSQVVTSPSPSALPATAGEEIGGGAILPGSTIETDTKTPIAKEGVSTRTIVFIVTGALALLLAGVMLYLRRVMN